MWFGEGITDFKLTFSQCQIRKPSRSGVASLGLSVAPPVVPGYPSGFSIRAHKGFNRSCLLVADLK